MQTKLKRQTSQVEVPQTFFDNFQELADDPITSPLEAWTELMPDASHMEQPLGPYAPGGGVSLGAGAGDTIEDHSQQATQSQQSNYQIPLSILDVPALDNVSVGNPYGVQNISESWGELQTTDENWMTSEEWQALRDGPPVLDPSLSNIPSPSGEEDDESEEEDGSHRRKDGIPPRELSFDDVHAMNSIARASRAANSTAQQKELRRKEVCHWVSQRSHENTGASARKGKGSQLQRIRAWYFCRGK